MAFLLYIVGRVRLSRRYAAEAAAERLFRSRKDLVTGDPGTGSTASRYKVKA